MGVLRSTLRHQPAAHQQPTTWVQDQRRGQCQTSSKGTATGGKPTTKGQWQGARMYTRRMLSGAPLGCARLWGGCWVSLSRTDVGAGAKTRCTPWLSPGQWTSQCSEPRMGQSTSPARGTTRRHCRTLSLPSIGRHQDCSIRSRKGTISGPSHTIEYTDTSESAQAHAARGQQQQASATLLARSPTS